MSEQNNSAKHTWEEAIEILRNMPEHQKLVYDAYLTRDLVDNSQRFYNSEEFKETLKLIKKYKPDASEVLDIPAGNGIATYAFLKAGFLVTAVEPDSSDMLGRGAIKFVTDACKFACNIVNSYGEELPFEDEKFDVVYVRQGLHHAHDLLQMLKEYYRVLKKGGLLVACREHVVDDKHKSLEAFLAKQVDHQLYGGENAFLLKEYIGSMQESGFNIIEKIGPYDSAINLHPFNIKDLEEKILQTTPGKIISKVFPKKLVIKIAFAGLKLRPRPGRLYSFVASK